MTGRVLFTIAIAGAGCGGGQKTPAKNATPEPGFAGILAAAGDGDVAFDAPTDGGDASSVGDDDGEGGFGFGRHGGDGEEAGGGIETSGSLGHGEGAGQRTHVGLVTLDGDDGGGIGFLLQSQRAAYDACVPAGLHGTIYVNLSIDERGAASGVVATGIRDDLDHCVERAIRTIAFDPPDDGRAHAVDFQIEIDP
jgi:hypothetical protein